MRSRSLFTGILALTLTSLGCALPAAPPSAPTADDGGPSFHAGNRPATATLGTTTTVQTPVAQTPVKTTPRVTTPVAPRETVGQVTVGKLAPAPAVTAQAPGPETAPIEPTIESHTATPLLTATEQAAATTTGTTVSAAGAVEYTIPEFEEVRTFTGKPAVQVLNFQEVIAADGTTLSVTTDAGANWTVYKDVGVQPIKAVHFFTPTDGWVAGEKGTLLKVSISGGTLTYTIANPRLTGTLVAVAFRSALKGFVAEDLANTISNTTDGTSWAKLTSTSVSKDASFREDGTGGLLFLPHAADSTETFTNLLRYQEDANGLGSFAKVTVDTINSFTKLSTGSNIAYFRGSDKTWYSTINWTAFTKRNADLLTATQLIADGADALFPVDASTLFARTRQGEFCVSRNGGLLWSNPKPFKQSFSWLKPFSETQMWALHNGALWRTELP